MDSQNLSPTRLTGEAAWQDLMSRPWAAVDFETFYCSKTKYSLSNMTAHDYIRDDRFDPYLVSVVQENGDTYVGHPRLFDWARLDRHVLVIHNASFDGLIIKRMQELGTIPTFNYLLFDSCDMCAGLNYPRNLAGAVKSMLGISISKAARAAMDGKTWDDLDDEQRKVMEDYALDDSEYCLRLALSFREEWGVTEWEISKLNRENTTWGGLYADREEVAEALRILETRFAEAEAALPWAAEGKSGSRNHFITWIKDQVDEDGNPLPVPHSVSKSDPGFAAWLEKYGNLPVVKARLDVASLNSHVSRLKSMLERLDTDNTIRFDSLYFGAHTGRFSGGRADSENSLSRKFNLYNLPKGGRDGTIHGVDVRGLLRPRPGHQFVIFDYGQIEPRITHWIARNTAFLELASQEDIYQAAAKVMGWYPADKFNLRKDDNQLRQLAKAVTIGLGYGMGATKFVDTCIKDGTELEAIPKAQWNLDRRLKFIIRNVANRHWDNPEDEEWLSLFMGATKVVTEWRQKNAPVVALWNLLQEQLTNAAQSKSPVHYFTLPSGRRKPFWAPVVGVQPKIIFDPETGEPKQMIESRLKASLIKDDFNGPKPLHGGPLTENVVQSTARDVMCAGILAVNDATPLRANGRPVWDYRFNVYDEIIWEVPDGAVEEATYRIPRLLVDTTNPRLDWAHGLPLEVEGGAGDRYTVGEREWSKTRTADVIS